MRYIVSKLDVPSVEITEGLHIAEPFVLCTYTDGLGDVPELVEAFMRQNFQHCTGIIASGNRNFGVNFARAADVLSQRYDLPIVAKLDLRGQQADFEQIQNFLTLK